MIIYIYNTNTNQRFFIKYQLSLSMKKDKSEISIWVRIKNYYNNSPWNAAFTLPILVLIICPILILAIITGLESIVDTDGFIFGVLFVFLPYVLVPIWVFAGLIVSKKKLPYILSLIIGFGLLFFLFYIGPMIFAVDSVNAKSVVTKTINAQTIKYISAEIQRCKLGDSKFMNNNQDCPATVLKAINGAVATMTHVNPYDTAKLSIRLSNSNTNDEDVGYVSLSGSGSDIIIKTCNKTPCKKEENRLQDSIGIE